MPRQAIGVVVLVLAVLLAAAVLPFSPLVVGGLLALLNAALLIP